MIDKSQKKTLEYESRHAQLFLAKQSVPLQCYDQLASQVRHMCQEYANNVADAYAAANVNEKLPSILDMSHAKPARYTPVDQLIYNPLAKKDDSGSEGMGRNLGDIVYTSSAGARIANPLVMPYPASSSYGYRKSA